METGELIIDEKKEISIPQKAIVAAIGKVREGKFIPNRENDELTRALGNPEHPGTTRGKGVIPWYEGFSEWNDDYRTRARKKMEEEKKRKRNLKERIKKGRVVFIANIIKK